MKSVFKNPEFLLALYSEMPSFEGGSLHEVSLLREGQATVLRVVDTGTGIPEAELPKVFDPFYRCDKSRHLPGNGLGLSLVRSFVTAHGGTVRILAVADGTDVCVSFPASSEKKSKN